MFPKYHFNEHFLDMRIFVTGFGPFGDFPSNPSTVVVDGLRECFECRDVELMTSTVDVAYAESLKCSKMANEELEADVLILNNYF